MNDTVPYEGTPERISDPDLCVRGVGIGSVRLGNDKKYKTSVPE